MEDIIENSQTSTEEKRSPAWKYFKKMNDYKTSHKVGYSSFSYI